MLDLAMRASKLEHQIRDLFDGANPERVKSYTRMDARKLSTEEFQDLSAFARTINQAFYETSHVVCDAACLRRPRWFDEHGEIHHYADPTYDRVRDQIVGRTWTDIGGSKFVEWFERTEAPHMLSAKGLFLMLPAYFLNAENTVRSMEYGDMLETGYTLEPLVSALTSPSTVGGAKQQAFSAVASIKQRDAMIEANQREFDEFLNLLSYEQRKVVRDFLLRHRSYFDGDPINAADLALESF